MKQLQPVVTTGSSLQPLWGDIFYLVIEDESGCLKDYSAKEDTSQRIMQSCPSQGGWEILDDMS